MAPTEAAAIAAACVARCAAVAPPEYEVEVISDWETVECLDPRAPFEAKGPIGLVEFSDCALALVTVNESLFSLTINGDGVGDSGPSIGESVSSSVTPLEAALGEPDAAPFRFSSEFIGTTATMAVEGTGTPPW